MIIRMAYQKSYLQDLSKGTMLGRMLMGATARASSKDGAQALLHDNKFMNLVQDALKRPSSGAIYTQWASGEDLLIAARVGANVLKYCYDQKEGKVLLRGILAAAQACSAVQPKAAAEIAIALCNAECDAAGRHHPYASVNLRRRLLHMS